MRTTAEQPRLAFGALARTGADLADRLLGAVAARTFPAYAGLVALYALFRAGGFSNIDIWMTDTPSYEQTAAHPISSVDFLGGTRPFTVPLFIKVFGSADARIIAQLVISTFCWLVFAAAVARSVRHPVVRLVAFVTVLGFSLTREVTVWDTYLISESITFSLLALALAAWLMLLRNPSPARVTLVLGLMLLWAFARDSNAYVVLAVAALVALTLIDARRRPLKLALVAGCVAIFAASFASAEAGQRWLVPLKDVVFRRVIETPEMTRYFAQRGLSTEGNWTVTPWLEHARGVYAGYLLRHPGYTLTAPFHGRQEALYSTPDNLKSLFEPDLGNYDTNEGIGFMRPPETKLGRIFFSRDLSVVFGLAALALVLAAVLALRGALDVVWLVPAGVLVSTYPHMLAVWHFSGYEVDRHALEAALLVRLGAFVLLLVCIDGALRMWRERSLADECEAGSSPLRT